MSELVEYNLEQSLPFFEELKSHIDDEKIKELVIKRKHFEHKIVSKNRTIESFIAFITHEKNVLLMLFALPKNELQSLINHQMNFIERLTKQMCIHFQSQPRAFLLATKIMRLMLRTTSERYYWDQLLIKHGQKDVRFYTSAALNVMQHILGRINIRQTKRTKSKLKKIEEKLNSAKRVNRATQISKLEKEQRDLINESEKTKQRNYIEHMDWTRKRFLDGFNEFPKHKLLFQDFLKFELINFDFFQNLKDEDLIEGGKPIQDGLLVNYLLEKLKEYFDDVEYYRAIVDMIETVSPNYSSELLDEIKEIVRDSSEMNENNGKSQDKMDVSEPASESDLFDQFQQKFPDLRVVRTKNPSVIGTEFHNYLQTLKGKMISGEVDSAKELQRVRSALEWILNDPEWSSVSLDIWWDYYEIEKACGDFYRANIILQNAHNRLSKIEWKNQLTTRRMQEQSQ